MSNIDWSMLITKAMKDESAAQQLLTETKVELNARNNEAALHIARIQDRLDTLSFAIEIGEVTEEEVAEHASLTSLLLPWKKYKYALGKVVSLPIWPTAPAWPVKPPIPVIAAMPTASGTDL